MGVMFSQKMFYNSESNNNIYAGIFVNNDYNGMCVISDNTFKTSDDDEFLQVVNQNIMTDLSFVSNDQNQLEEFWAEYIKETLGETASDVNKSIELNKTDDGLCLELNFYYTLTSATDTKTHTERFLIKTSNNKLCEYDYSHNVYYNGQIIESSSVNKKYIYTFDTEKCDEVKENMSQYFDI